MRQLFNKPHYSTSPTLCCSVANNNFLSYAYFKRLGNYFWAVFFIILLSGLLSPNSASATSYWEIKGNKEFCYGGGHQKYYAHTNYKYSNITYNWTLEGNSCYAKIEGYKNRKDVWVNPGSREGSYKLKCVIRWKSKGKYYSQTSYHHVVVKPIVIVKAGPDQEFCGLPTKVDLDGYIKGCKDGGYWSKVYYKASGEIKYASSAENAYYIPSPADLERGYAELKLTAKCYSRCGVSYDIVKIKFFKQPTIIAGTYAPICGKTAVNLDASFTNASSATWEVVPAANGTITQVNANAGTAVFTPSDAVAAAGTDVTLKVTTNNPDGPCGPANADVIIQIDQPATANAGLDQTICYFRGEKDEVRVNLSGVFGGSATNGSFSVVSPTGGTITPVSTIGNVVTATFDPSNTQIKAGSVTLRFSTNDPNSGNVCPAATEDVVINFEKGYYAYCGKNHDHGDHDDNCDKDEHNICSHDKKHQLNCKYTGPGGGYWSHNGSGKFDDVNSLTPTYEATDEEIAAGKTIEAIFTPYGDGKKCVRPCKFVIHCKRDDDCGHCYVKAGTPAYTPISCFGGTTTVTINDSRGRNLEYSLDGENYQESNVFNNVTAGVYKPYVRNTKQRNCVDYGYSFEIGQPAVIALSATITNVSCRGAGDGDIDLTVAGGTAPYTYLWTRAESPGFSETTQDLVDVGFGSYTVKVTDQNGCTNSATYEITRPDRIKLTAEIYKIRPRRDGSIDLSVEGGTAPYTYKWFFNGHLISEEQDLSGLRKEGNYRVIVTDAKGCSSVCKFYVEKVERENGCDCHKKEGEYEDDDNSLIETVVDIVNPSAARKAVDQTNLANVEDQKLSVYPNEMLDRSTIEFKLDKNTPYILNLYDHTGRLVKQISSGNAKAGEVRKFTIDGTALKSGIYHGRLITPTESRYTRILKK